MGAPERLNPRLDGTNTHLQIARLKDILARLDERAAALMVPGAFRKKLEAAGAKGPKDANNDSNSITRTEFVELLVRVAAVGSSYHRPRVNKLSYQIGRAHV